jgi:hypothetical protein
MAAYDYTGPWTDAVFTLVRLSVDQTLENATGVGAPPWYVASASRTAQFW